MSDTVTSKILLNTSRRLVMHFTSLSDGTGESSVVKVDKSELKGSNNKEPSSLVVEKIHGTISGLSLRIFAAHTTPITIARLGPLGDICIDYRQYGGFQTEGEGSTGDIVFTTTGHDDGDTYNIVIEFRKKN